MISDMSGHGAPELAGSPARTAPTGAAPALGLSGISVRFGGIIALQQVSFDVADGESVGLIGPNGAGKTTLLDVAAGLRRPQAGEVRLHGDVITRASVVRRARLGIARTFQQLSLFDGMTVREHVLFGYLAAMAPTMPLRGALRRRSRLERAASADDSPLSPPALLSRLGLEQVADQLAGEQSVGIVRMVDLARALASRPRVLLLDEPVSGLSEHEAEDVGQVLLSLRADHALAMLVVEHNLEFARLVSDRIVALDFGEVIAVGAPGEVLASDELRRAYFGAEADTEGVGEADPPPVMAVSPDADVGGH
jgi:branched-chain amino acid transport system ATP-binding protein